MRLEQHQASRRARLSPDELERLLKMLPRCSDDVICDVLSLSRSAVRKRRQIFGIPQPRPRLEQPIRVPGNDLEAEAKRRGFATVSPIIKAIVDAYDAGRFARLRWGDAAVCPYASTFEGDAWRMGYEAR